MLRPKLEGIMHEKCRQIVCLFFPLSIIAGLFTPLFAAQRTWDGGGSDNLASNAQNWSGDIVPVAGDAIVLDGTSTKNMTWNLNIANIGSWSQSSAYTGSVTINTQYSGGIDTLRITGDCSINGGKWRHSANTTAQTYRLCVKISGNFTLGSSGQIDVSARGYNKDSGPGKPSGYWTYGAAYGGVGGYQNSGTAPSTYGSYSTPIDLGSGGNDANSGNGGGAILLKIAGSATISGSILANGQSTGTATGSGGSIFIIAATISGSGTISANGGTATNTGYCTGGGGRIAVLLTQSGAGFSGLTTPVAYGGNNSEAWSCRQGAAGTVYLDSTNDGNTDGRLIIDNTNRGCDLSQGVDTRIPASQTWTVGKVVMKNKGHLWVPGGATLTTIGTGTTITITASGDSLINQGTLNIGGTGISNSGTFLSSASTSKAIYKGQSDNANVTVLAGAYYWLEADKSGTLFNQGGATTISSGGTLKITNGTYDLNGNNISATGATFTNNDVLQLKGSETVTGLTPSTSSGTVSYDDGNQTGLKLGNAYYNLAFNGSGTYTLNAALDCNGNLSINSGGLAAAGNTINVAGNWSNSATFTHGNGKVILDGPSQTISGPTTFYKLQKTISSAATLTFAAGSTQTIGDSCTLKGAAGQLLSLRSSSTGNQWNIAPAANKRDIQYVDVKDANNQAPPSINPANSVNSGNNTNWFANLARKLYWHGATSNFSTLSNWKTDQAGTTSAAYREKGDTLLFNGTGANHNANCSMTANDTCNRIDFTGYTGSFDWASYTLADSGDAVFASGMTTGANWTISLIGVKSHALTLKSNATHPAINAAGSGNIVVSATSTGDATVASWTQQSGYTGTVTINTRYSGGMDSLKIADGCVLNGGKWTHPTNTTAQTYRLCVRVGGNFTLGSSGQIDVSACGYNKDSGPGKPSGYWTYGAAYGGVGGYQNNGTAPSTYGSYSTPIDLGSGGNDANSGNGGGAVLLRVLGSATVSGGILANGQTSGTATGSGGSIFLTASTISGAGTISANGGTDTTTGYCTGGGGRIAVLLTQSGASFSALTTPVAYGGDNSEAWSCRQGAAGTVFLDSTNDGVTDGRLIIDNSNRGCNLVKGVDTRIPAAQSWIAGNIVMKNKGHLWIPSGATLTTIGTGTTITITSSGDSLFNQGALNINGTAIANNGAFITNSTTSLVTYTGQTDDQMVTVAPVAYYDIVFNNENTEFRLAADLSCHAFLLNRSTLNLNNHNIFSTGNFSVVGSAVCDAFMDLAGRTIYVTGNADFAGNENRLLNLNPASEWSISVNNNLTAEYAMLANSRALYASGTAASTCLDLGGNINWNFQVNVADYSQWPFHTKITINTGATGANVVDPAYNFPMLIRLDQSTFPFAQAKADGSDLRFTAQNGADLAFQIENWSATSATIWVKVPIIYGNNSDQYITMYWGKPNAPSTSSDPAVFNYLNGFVGAWHMDQDPGASAPQIHDATSNAINGTSQGSMTSANLVDGLVGKAVSFDGGNDYIDFGNGAATDITGNVDITISAWAKLNVVNDWDAIFGKGDHQYHIQFRLDPVHDEFCIFDDADWQPAYNLGQPSIIANTWYFVTGTYNHTTKILTLYRNGTAIATASSDHISSSRNDHLALGVNSEYMSRYINGTIDEARLCNIARSPAWIKLEYENQKASQTLVQLTNIKTEEIVYTDGEIVQEYNTSGQMTRATIDFDGEGRMEKDKNGGSWDVHYRFYVKDHLGSTRVVLNGDAPQATPVQSMAYDPYGKLISLADQAAEHTTREQFTGKELDMDGAANSIDFNVQIGNIILYPTSARTAWITLYYDDGSSETIPIEVSGDGTSAGLNAAIGFKDGRTLSQVRFTCNTTEHTIFDHWYDCPDQNISGNLHYKITLLNPDNNANPLPVNTAPVTTSSFISIAEDASPVAFGGMGKEYFGARYFDPEVGVWSNCDKVGQLFNSYGYSANPVVYVDKDGNLVWFIPVIIGAAIGTWQGYNIGRAKSAKGWGMFGYMFGGGVIGGVAGLATAGIGTAVSTWATGAIGASLGGWGGAGFTATTLGGAAGGSISSAINASITGFGMGHLAGLRGDQVWGQTWKGAAAGAITGGMTGGVTNAIKYASSTQFRWQTHETILKYAYSHDKMNQAIRYAVGMQGQNSQINMKAVFYDPTDDIRNQAAEVGSAGSAYLEDEKKWGMLFGPDAVNDYSGKFDPSILWEHAIHETGHVQGLTDKLLYNFSSGIIPNNQYYQFWSEDTKKFVLESILYYLNP
jgi:hypothetical protein